MSPNADNDVDEPDDNPTLSELLHVNDDELEVKDANSTTAPSQKQDDQTSIKHRPQLGLYQTHLYVYETKSYPADLLALLNHRMLWHFTKFRHVTRYHIVSTEPVARLKRVAYTTRTASPRIRVPLQQPFSHQPSHAKVQCVPPLLWLRSLTPSATVLLSDWRARQRSRKLRTIFTCACYI